MVLRVCQFTEIVWCLEYVNLQRFYGALSMSIYRDFMVPRVCQFTEILWCPEYVNLQRFYGTPSMSIYRDFMVSRVCQFTEILHDQAKRVKSKFKFFDRRPVSSVVEHQTSVREVAGSNPGRTNTQGL